mgnify:CR=1 FL=1
MYQKAKNNGQFIAELSNLSEEYKKDVFCNFVYGFEPFNLYILKNKLEFVL